MNITFLKTLCGVFMALNIYGVIAWPWLWILDPAWMMLSVFAVFAAIAFFVVWKFSKP